MSNTRMLTGTCSRVNSTRSQTLLVMDTQTTATQLISASLNLRRTHPHAPPEDLLKLVFESCGTDVLQSAVALATTSCEQLGEFAQLVTDAADKCMTPAEWCGRREQAADSDTRGRLIAAWRDTVGAEFVACFGALQAPPVHPERRIRLRSI